VARALAAVSMELYSSKHDPTSVCFCCEGEVKAPAPVENIEHST
jgi:hypothetical protein